MEQPNQNLPNIVPEQTIGGRGDQPINQPAVAIEAGGAEPARAEPALPPIPETRKKRKPNASGSRKQSPSWDHFTRVPDHEVQDPTAACNYCGKRYLCDSKIHGTSNLGAHTRVCPKYPYAVINDSSQTVLSFKPGEGNDMVAASQRFNLKACRNAVVMFVVLDEHSFSKVEGDGFKILCRTLQPQFTAPSRQTVARDCFQLFLDEKVKLKKFFRTECRRVALTTDCWTSCQNTGYLTLTAHFIDNEWNYQKRIISFAEVINHKGDTIGRKIEEILRDWGLRNVSTITVDNASSNDGAVSYLKTRLKNFNGLVLDGQFLHMRCCAHILNLVVNDGLVDLNSSINSIRGAIRFVRSSSQRKNKFKECIQFSNISSKKLVCLDVPTRWNSTYLMLDAAEKLQVAFEKIEFEDRNYVLHFDKPLTPPKSIDWENARAFVRFLKIFYDATKIFSASVHLSIHTAFHQLCFIYTEILNCIASPNPVLSKMGQEMKKKYDKYWGNVENMNQLLYFGVILDPRNKLTYVEWSLREMYPDNPNLVRLLSESIKENLGRMYSWYLAAHEQSIRGKQQANEESSGGDKPVAAEAPSHVARRAAFLQHLKEKNSIEERNELERYLGEAIEKSEEKFDLLLWWKHNSSRLPVLSMMARDVFATPVSTVASESAFSAGGRVIDIFRSSLSAEMTEGLICTQNWLRPCRFQFKDLDLSDELEESENIVAELLKLAGTTIGDGDDGQSSQSQPMRCD
ncbi:zinc finger BED domain-containing protein RICESLEEPER 2-like [Lotus japonicus]|uniref:zinc finger BED domain-containing protein RICESLEEPER 2-like n=2 Tax=Lotus japonicus TaxID=34305 RepID=UPI00258D11E3|nr:zinc finger BED domain-containing protein RICESLEEPER 2-like [Lotus japonicus]XP_057436088.1 zinc finger BED domain-containing protein RICESLEEPER 2-like [Lotus japonicus]XP_057436089.1 zinc finger BED domain-containing protein RICESLEEPER 2-like [Lotus japonicus]XP_057436090.1 zinc finger BED domain-containing protein RICESLEEPER 2-like [Lotus japonicus]XP_057436091.1 zinc finger BED domain-containing protein RICESLEEPER 2-like [Lotus japonicus]